MKKTAYTFPLVSLSRILALCASLALFVPPFAEAAESASKKPAEKQAQYQRGGDSERAGRGHRRHAQHYHHEGVRHLMEASEHLKAAGFPDEARSAREHAERIWLEMEVDHSTKTSAVRVHELERKVEALSKELEAIRKGADARPTGAAGKASDGEKSAKACATSKCAEDDAAAKKCADCAKVCATSKCAKGDATAKKCADCVKAKEGKCAKCAKACATSKCAKDKCAKDKCAKDKCAKDDAAAKTAPAAKTPQAKEKQ